MNFIEAMEAMLQGKMVAGVNTGYLRIKNGKLQVNGNLYKVCISSCVGWLDWWDSRYLTIADLSKHEFKLAEDPDNKKYEENANKQKAEKLRQQAELLVKQAKELETSL